MITTYNAVIITLFYIGPMLNSYRYCIFTKELFTFILIEIVNLILILTTVGLPYYKYEAWSVCLPV